MLPPLAFGAAALQLGRIQDGELSLFDSPQLLFIPTVNQDSTWLFESSGLLNTTHDAV